MHALILTSLCLLASKQVFGLQCYATDLDKVKSEKVIQHTAMDCNKNLQESAARTGTHLGTNFPEAMLRCYKVTITGAETMVIKGCLVDGGCELMQKTFEHFQVGQVAHTTCDECEGNLCNGVTGKKSVPIIAAMALAAVIFMIQ